jgi:hypothetical protein
MRTKHTYFNANFLYALAASPYSVLCVIPNVANALVTSSFNTMIVIQCGCVMVEGKRKGVLNVL